MSERMPWFRCVPSALLGALAGMRPDEGYVYVVVLMRIYETGGPVAESDRTMSRRTGLTERKVAAAIQFLIETSKLVRLPDGRLDSMSTHAEIEWQIERRKDQSKAGKASRNKTNASSAKPDNLNGSQKGQQNQQIDATPVEHASNHIEKEREYSSVAKATGAEAPIDPTKAVRDRLWMDGPAALVGMGQREHTARQLIGRWLKMTGDDPGRVHAAIEEAQIAGTGDPIPYIARVLSDRPNRGPPSRQAKPSWSDLARSFAEEERNGQPAHHAPHEPASGRGDGRGARDRPNLFEPDRLGYEPAGPVIDAEFSRSEH